MSRLRISPRHFDALTRHAAAAYPEEGCGVLIGRGVRDGDDREKGSLVERVLSVRNESTHAGQGESRRNRYLIAPETVLTAERQARELGLAIVGYYHSHPDHPARPSEFDREHAWPGVSYVIVSVEAGEVKKTRSWRLADDRSGFAEEEIDRGDGSGPVPVVMRQEEVSP